MMDAGQTLYDGAASNRRALRRNMKGGLSVVCPWGGEKLFRCGPVRSQEAAICSCNDSLRPVVFKLEASGREN